VVDLERRLLESRGHHVSQYIRSANETVDSAKLTLAASSVWNRSSNRRVSELIASERIDVAHFHNLFPLVSPSAIWAVGGGRGAGAPPRY